MAYSRRPPPGPVPNGVGDFESVSYSGSAHVHGSAQPQLAWRGNPTIPPSSGYGEPYPAHYAGSAGAPGSLDPVAMAMVSSAIATGPQRAQPQESGLRARPTVRTGVSILLAGMLFGGGVGVSMRVHQSASDAAFAAQVAANPTSRPLAGIPEVPSVLPPADAAPEVVAPKGPGAVVSSPITAANDKKDTKEKRTSRGLVKAGGHGSPSKVSASSSKRESSKDKDDEGWTVASAGGNEPTSATREPKETKVEKSEPKETKAERSEPKATAKKGGAGKAVPDDANAVLKAAMGATENTL